MKRITGTKSVISNKYKITHTVSDIGDELIVTSTAIIPKESKYAKNLIEKGISPITEIQKEIERNHRKLVEEEKTTENCYIEIEEE